MWQLKRETLWKCKLYGTDSYVIGFIAGQHSKGYYVVLYDDGLKESVNKVSVYKTTKEIKRFTGFTDRLKRPVFEDDILETTFKKNKYIAKIIDGIGVVRKLNNHYTFVSHYDLYLSEESTKNIINNVILQ